MRVTRGGGRVGLALALVLIGTPFGQPDQPASAQIPVPGAFAKTGPPMGTGVLTSVTLSWGASSGAASYEYCADSTNDNFCSSSWINVGNNTSVVALFIAYSDFWWQVRARNGNNITQADNGQWWRLRGLLPPQGFAKTAPADGATNQSTSLVLQWTASVGLTRYEYCRDTIVNGACDGGWLTNGLATSVAIDGLAAGARYEWQVRAVNVNGTTDADAGAWRTFTTAGPPVVTGHPQSQSTAAGQTVTLSVAADGASPLTYQWYAGTSGDISAPIAGGTGAMFTTPPVTGTSRYWVRVSNPLGSADSQTAAVTIRFTDESLVSRVTIIRDVHVAELRARIDALRARVGLAPFAWADPILAAGTRIRARHIVDLREALDGVYARTQLPPPVYTDGELTPGVTAVKAAHVQEIRAAVVALE